MNEWSRRTIELAQEQNYLDQLQRIYPHEDGHREVGEGALETIRDYYSLRDGEKLLNALLDQQRFPYNESYVSFLRKDRSAINRNPETITRIFDRLYEMGIDDVISGLTKPIEANRRRGMQFKNWLKLNFVALKADQFVRSTEGIVVFKGTEKIWKTFCNEVLNMGHVKRPDFVGKVGTRYVVGEAKFLSDSGGNQDRAFDDGMSLATNSTGRAYKIFILDGVLWLASGSDQFERIDNTNAPVFSALMLNEYLESI